MARCANCFDKFDQKYFLQKCCDKIECRKFEMELKLSTPDLKRTKVKKVSKKRQQQNKEYNQARLLFLSLPENKTCPVTGSSATEIHHMNGRENERLLDQKYWLAVSRVGHRWIHDNPLESREKGWFI